MEKKYLISVLAIVALGFGLHLTSQQEAKKEKEQFIGTKQQAIDLINKLITDNSSFSVKLSHPLLPGKVRQWQQKGLVQFPTKQVLWEHFKKDVHQFGSYLHSLLDKNPQTGVYYHVENLQKNPTLYNALQDIQKTMALHEPKIEHLSPFKLDKESLEALQKIINLYGTQFYQNKLLDTIKEFFKGFEKEAEKIRAVEEAAEKKAAGKPTFDTVDRGDFDFDTTDYDIDYDIDLEPEYATQDYEDVDIDDSDDFISSFFE